MFRDRKEELDRLEAALLDADNEDTAPDEEEFFEEEEEADAPLPDFDAYNSDVTDEDLEEYSETVYDGGRRSPLGALAVVLVLLTGVLLALAWWLLKYGGFLG